MTDQMTPTFNDCEHIIPAKQAVDTLLTLIHDHYFENVQPTGDTVAEVAYLGVKASQLLDDLNGLDDDLTMQAVKDALAKGFYENFSDRASFNPVKVLDAVHVIFDDLDLMTIRSKFDPIKTAALDLSKHLHAGADYINGLTPETTHPSYHAHLPVYKAAWARAKALAILIDKALSPKP